MPPDETPMDKTMCAAPTKALLTGTLAWPRIHLKSLRSLGVGLALGFLLTGCAGWRRTLNPPAPSPSATADDLVFLDITLEQVSPNGDKVWELEASKATYQNDRKVAMVDQPTGLLFHEGTAVYRVSAQRGQVDEDGLVLSLEGAVTLAILDGDQGQLQGDRLTWHPQEKQFVLEQNLKGQLAGVEFTAQQASLNQDRQELTLGGTIRAHLIKARLHLESEQLVWAMAEKHVTSPGAVVLSRYGDTDPQAILQRATGDRLTADLEPERFTLGPNALVELRDSALTVESDRLIWDVQGETVTSPEPLNLKRSTDQVAVQAQVGALDLSRQVVTLTGAVQGWSPQEQSRLWSDRLVWDLPQDQVEATGSVRYEQSNPSLTMVGDRAVGQLAQDQITITSSNTDSGRSVKTVYVLP